MNIRHLIHNRYKFVALLVLAICLLSSTSVSADETKLEFANAFGVYGQRWSRVWDTYIANGKVGYIISDQSIFRQTKSHTFEELRLDESLIDRYGIPDQVAVDVSGRIYVTHKLNLAAGVWNSTLIQYDQRAKMVKAIPLGLTSFEDLEIIDGTTVTGLERIKIADEQYLYRICDIRNGIKTLMPIPDEFERKPRRYRVHKNKRWLAYSGLGLQENTSKIVELTDYGFDHLNEYTIGPDNDWGAVTDFCFIEKSLVCVNGARVVIINESGVLIKRFDPNDDPIYNNIGYSNVVGYADGTFMINHGWGSTLRLNLSGDVIREYGGYGKVFTVGATDLAGTAINDNEVWIPLPSGIQVLGPNERLFQIDDSNGSPAYVHSIANFDDVLVYAAYTSTDRNESGIAIIDPHSYRVKDRIMVVDQPGYYAKVFVLEKRGKPVVFVQAPNGLITNNRRIVLPGGHGELKQAGNSLLVRTIDGFNRINPDGRLSTKIEYGWLSNAIASSYAFLSDGSYTDGLAMYDYKGNVMAYYYPGAINGVVAVGKDRLLLHTNEYLSTIWKY